MIYRSVDEPLGTRFSEEFLSRLHMIFHPVASEQLGSNIDINAPTVRPYLNFAYAVQQKVEGIVLQIVEYYFKHHTEGKGARNLVLSGGFALNIAVNGKVVRSGLVGPNNLYVPPFPADDGTPLGAALSVASEEYGAETFYPLQTASLGRAYGDEEIKKILDRFGLVEGRDYDRVENEDELVAKVSDVLAAYQTVGWFQGAANLDLAR